MPESNSQLEQAAQNKPPTVLLTGATGYIGSQLLQLLKQRNVEVRCFAREPEKLRCQVGDSTEVVKGDVLDRGSLAQALAGVTTAYYLIHLMESSGDFEQRDRKAAQNFAAAVREAGVQRMVYMGGLGDESDPELSPHLRSRHEVGRILRDSGVETIEFRASAVLGHGSLSFDLIRALTNRLPVMICPRWLTTPTQPIAIDDVLAYLMATLDMPRSESQILEIGCSDVVTYGQLIRKYARLRGLRRWLISIPFMTPYFSGLWLRLITPEYAEVGKYLIEGLKNPTVVRDEKAKEVFSIQPMGIDEAMNQTIEEAKKAEST